MNELQKEYCVKIKLIALDWQWVTLISWCQMNRDIDSSPAIHKMEGETHFFLEKLRIRPWKSTFFWRFFCEVISDHFCSHLFFFLKIQMILPQYFTHVWLCLDLFFPLLLAIWWFRFGFGSCEWKRQKQKRPVGFMGS